MKLLQYSIFQKITHLSSFCFREPSVRNLRLVIKASQTHSILTKMVFCRYRDSVGLNSRSGMNEKSKNGENKQVFHWDLRALRLPKLVEADPRGKELLRGLTAHTLPLWPGGKTRVPTVAFNSALLEALRIAQKAGQMVRSLEDAELKLAAEGRGLALVDQKSGVPRGERVSRLLVLADNGADRFYRAVETLLRQHGPRVLALRLDVKAETLGQMLFDPGQRVLLLLLDHKEAVSAMLLAQCSG